MKDIISKAIFIFFDIIMIMLAIYFSYVIRGELEGLEEHTIPLSQYLQFYPLFVVPILLFTYEGIYSYRYDFWHESRLILKGIVFSAILIFAYLAMTQMIVEYSRLVIGISFVLMATLIPLSKNINKKIMHKLGLWQKKAKIYGNDPFLTDEIYGNPYLGYIKPKANETPSTVFINSKENDLPTLKKIISSQIKDSYEVIFIPLMDDYDLTHSHIYDLANTRTNLIVFQNRLKSPIRTQFKNISDFTLSLMIFPFLIPIMLFIAYKIKHNNPNEKILFKQKRLGKSGKPFSCYKFQTMYENGNKILEAYLKEHPEEIAYYETYHKYKNDPRVTEIGHFLRHTSLDELPQIYNVFRGDMSFIGPRPYMLNEKGKIGEELETILSVKPGITGLWQVSGRSDVDFYSRVELDVWYIRNWNLWMDLVILLKTIKTVLVREGAS
ncbi:sugar transferase [Sulfurovum sp. NBC37-1]|uniref:sugar transferase n=1 Tax=Sulfurovum sp. (strain NBC37-1) TaxID=387093 RepID=UPI0001587CE3|nr:sugar transferase [Sulfurovum sp. NBC37-1]BAF72886.1 glycosyl transferase [Sulfurovum sp. NBC37-1]